MPPNLNIKTAPGSKINSAPSKDLAYYQTKNVGKDIKIGDETYKVTIPKKVGNDFVYELEEIVNGTKVGGIQAEMLENALKYDDIKAGVETAIQGLGVSFDKKSKIISEKLHNINKEIAKLSKSFPADMKTWLNKNFGEIKDLSSRLEEEKVKLENIKIEITDFKNNVDSRKKDDSEMKDLRNVLEMLKEEVVKEVKERNLKIKKTYEKDKADYEKEIKEIEKNSKEIEAWKQLWKFDDIKKQLGANPNNTGKKKANVNVSEADVLSEIKNKNSSDPTYKECPKKQVPRFKGEPQKPVYEDEDLAKQKNIAELSEKYDEGLLDIITSSKKTTKTQDAAKKLIKNIETYAETKGHVFDFNNDRNHKDLYTWTEEVFKKMQNEYNNNKAGSFDLKKEMSETKNEMEKEYNKLKDKEMAIQR